MEFNDDLILELSTYVYDYMIKQGYSIKTANNINLLVKFFIVVLCIPLIPCAFSQTGCNRKKRRTGELIVLEINLDRCIQSTHILIYRCQGATLFWLLHEQKMKQYCGSVSSL